MTVAACFRYPLHQATEQTLAMAPARRAFPSLTLNQVLLAFSIYPLHSIVWVIQVVLPVRLARLLQKVAAIRRRPPPCCSWREFVLVSITTPILTCYSWESPFQTLLVMLSEGMKQLYATIRLIYTPCRTGNVSGVSTAINFFLRGRVGAGNDTRRPRQLTSSGPKCEVFIHSPFMRNNLHDSCFGDDGDVKVFRSEEKHWQWTWVEGQTEKPGSQCRILLRQDSTCKILGKGLRGAR